MHDAARIDGGGSTLAGHDESASAAVKARLDWATPDERTTLAAAYPLEWDEWLREVENGYRTIQPDTAYPLDGPHT